MSDIPTINQPIQSNEGLMDIDKGVETMGDVVIQPDSIKSIMASLERIAEALEVIAYNTAPDETTEDVEMDGGL